MEVVKYLVKIKTETPIHISSGLQERTIVNKSLVKDLKGRAYIPGSTIKGAIRDNFFSIVEEREEPLTIFGREGYNPSRIFVDNFYAEENPHKAIRFVNSIDRFRKVLRENGQFCTETAYGQFTGEIEIYFDEGTIKYKEYILMAIKMITSIGQGKSRGLGKINIHLEEVCL